MLSETYRQSSHVRPELAERDPTNRLLARQARLRLSAEAVRDVALASSGLLNRTVGGPSVKPPQPESVSKEGFDNKWETSTGRRPLSTRALHVHPADLAVRSVRDVRFSGQQPHLHAARASHDAAAGIEPAERSGVCRGGTGACGTHLERVAGR